MSNPRTIRVHEEEAYTVARDEATEVEARGDNVPTALYTLSEKLEMKLLQ